MTRRNAAVKCLLILLLSTVIFYWQIVLTNQFTLLSEAEGVNQAYSWLNFWVANVRHGIVPLWDPYTFAGHSFPGEMQTSAFYPLNLILALVPFNRQGVFSPGLYHLWFAFSHFLAACLMFALARELGLRRFSSIIAGICFSFGGFVAHAEWLDMLQSSIWLPLVFLLVLRAMRAKQIRVALLYAALGGLTLGLTILAGRLHIAIMQALVIATAAVFAGYHSQLQGRKSGGREWRRPALVSAAVALIAFSAGAIQLLPSIEYSGHALRFLGGVLPPLPATQKIPYAYLSDGMWPHGFVGLLISYAFDGTLGGGEVMSPYMGVFPLFAAIIGVWRCWGNLWVRYLAGLAVVTFLYTLGSFSLLHGLLYVLVPGLWMAREAARFMYIASFSLALLAAFGVETLLREGAEKLDWRAANRILRWIVVAGALALMVPALFGVPQINAWISFSLLMIFISCGLLWHMIRGHTGTSVRVLMMALILFDLSAFNWSPRNKIQESRSRTNQLDKLLSCSGAANFLRSQPGPSRVEIVTDPKPNIGDVFKVPTISGMGATLMKETAEFLGHVDLLNVRYLLRPASASEPGAVYQDAFWKVYKRPTAYSGAWLVHEAKIEPSQERLLRRLDANEIDPLRQALLEVPLETLLEPNVEGANEVVRYQSYGPNRLELSVHAQSRGLLVLSEFFYPGWCATVNGRPERIYRVDGALRGIMVPRGESLIVVRYAPSSVIVGAALSLITFCGTLGALALHWRTHGSLFHHEPSADHARPL